MNSSKIQSTNQTELSPVYGLEYSSQHAGVGSHVLNFSRHQATSSRASAAKIENNTVKRVQNYNRASSCLQGGEVESDSQVEINVHKSTDESILNLGQDSNVNSFSFANKVHIKVHKPEDASLQGKCNLNAGVVLRRFNGFLIETCGKDSRVAIVDKGQMHQYFVPSKKLASIGVTEKNQPFELNEVQVHESDGPLNYEFKSVVNKSKKYKVKLELGQELEKKLNKVLNAIS
jgi:hypothetical protein